MNRTLILSEKEQQVKFKKRSDRNIFSGPASMIGYYLWVNSHENNLRSKAFASMLNMIIKILNYR